MRHRISFVGTGNVAWHMAQAFKTAGCEVAQIWSRRIENASLLAEKIGAEAINDIRQLRTNDVDAIIIAVADGAIETLAQQINAHETILIHTAGSVDISVLAHGAQRYGAAWPVQSLVKGTNTNMHEVPFCIEGCDNMTTETIRNILRQVSPKIYEMDGLQRRKAHLAACMVSNFGNALNALSQEMMEKNGIDFALLRPLIELTARKAEADNIWQQQTGAAARHDQSTIAAHRALIGDNDEVRQLYDIMTRIIEKHCADNVH